ncbi:hypothetical protein [Chitinophaga oryziterrae]|uniref:hypothetical protein n=1 Tax=Chitinophaga oryziterrae TaxID=1031224 RepID=UPI0012F9C049
MQELAKQTNTSYIVVGKYERDEINPSLEVAKNPRLSIRYYCSVFIGGSRQ